ncbi:lantibiotic dehydratase [Chitinophaga solisilvae]|uniref:lantibiotic dehydratase n=1 Tax=Chitinophaga solisilvae TaxID=1233460 RepID=UPI00137202B6|nr:lantibiotic dehydratase [Chitinophaga solisilvae]
MMYESTDSQQLKTFGFYLLRLPLLPYTAITSLHEKGPEDIAALSAAIRDIYAQPLLQEAIYLASPELHQLLLQWLSENTALKPHKEQKLLLTLYKYLLRMSTRCTPYGLFAGCAAGATGTDATAITFSGDDAEKVARLDMHYLTGIAGELLQDSEIADTLTYLPNTSIYRVGNTYRYYESQWKDNRRHYFLSTFSHTPYLEDLLDTARHGASMQELTAVLTALDVPDQDAARYISTLIQNQILVSAFHPTVTGPDYLSRLLTKLDKSALPGVYPAVLQSVQHLLSTPGTGISQYSRIREQIQEHFPALSAKDLIQIDLFHSTQRNQISSAAMTALTANLQQLSFLNTGRLSDDLVQFKKKFTDRYENRLMPLMAVLDTESGIGYGLISGDKTSYTPLVDDLMIPGANGTPQTSWTSFNKLVLDKCMQALSSQAYTVTLTDKDIQPFVPADGHATMPAAVSILGTLIASGPEALDNGDFQFILKAFNGPGALALLGRFAVNNPALTSRMQAIADYESDLHPDSIIAEIVHLPEGRIGNVLLRPQLYKYEIPFLGNASVDKEFRIHTDDLYVTVKDDRVVLISRSQNKEIIPRLTSAHNYADGQPVYKFLCDLQHQDAPFNVNWDWLVMQQASFLPRVSYNQVILKRAQWHLFSKEFTSLLEITTPAAALLTLRDKYKMPAAVVMSEGDNELFLDLSCVLAQQLLADKLQKHDVILFESLMEEDQLITNKKGSYCNEIMIPLQNTAYTRVSAATAAAPDHALSLTRTFAPGSEWLYAKIYCGPRWMDKLLTRELQPLIAELQHDGIIDSWFFIRFQDPGNHLRVRFHLPDSRQHSQHVINRLQEVFEEYLDQGIVHSIQLDSYIREIERYGAATMHLTETFFHQDSEMVLQLLPFIQSAPEDARWMYALKGADGILEDFGFSMTARQQLLQTMQQGFFREFNGDSNLQFQLNNKYRQHSSTIAALLGNTPDAALLPPAAMEIFHRRAVSGRPVSGQLLSLSEVPVQRLVADYLHMFLNRLFVANQRMHELVIYHYLLKYYTSILAREKARPEKHLIP